MTAENIITACGILISVYVGYRILTDTRRAITALAIGLFVAVISEYIVGGGGAEAFLGIFVIPICTLAAAYIGRFLRKLSTHQS